jgi:ABC-type Fe3+/spermidine/putrescine transport system ATPase subunit
MTSRHVAPIASDSGSAPAGDPRPVDAATVVLDVAHAWHRFGSVTALDDVSFQVKPGEFLTLLGPSGSGKTTLLRIIAGLERPTTIERMLLAGRDVRAVPAEERNVVTVFQHFALFPHMSVRENVEYGLRVRRRPVPERRRRALDALAMVRLDDKAERRIHQLSGGEKQRVALARAFVTEPDVLLLDEPLGSLDERLRLDMQTELIDLHRRLGATFILVTHSQEEAITISDRIVLMQAGRIEQQGTPEELFERPGSRFAAQFMGVENIFEGNLRTVEGRRAVLEVGGGSVTGSLLPGWHPSPGHAAFAAIRAEHVRLMGADVPVADGAFACRLTGRIYKGKYQDWLVDTRIGRVVGRVWDTESIPRTPSSIGWSAERCVIGPIDGSSARTICGVTS